jgi:DNA-binding response OmpR family regulator
LQTIIIARMRVLLVEDSEHLARSLKAGLSRLGHAVDVVGDGRKGLSYARLNPYDVIVLDLMLPKLDGITVLKGLRQAGRDIPVLVVTARDTVEDRVLGLREGADDYLVKPFAFDELAARIDALSRRRRGRAGPMIRIGDLTIDTVARRVVRGGCEIALKSREYSLLLFLAERPGQTISRTEIEDSLYGEDNFPMSNAVPSAICNLRARLNGEGRHELIHTRRGLGYVFGEAAL